MKLYFTTNRDRNGNTYYLFVDTLAKTYDSNWHPAMFPIRVSTGGRNIILNELREEGYNETR